jgi:hypothetical protein
MRSPVIVVGRFAFKFARDWRGRASNLYEAKLYRTANATRRTLLCPVLWVSRNGFVQIMRAAQPLTDMMSLDEYMDVAELWNKLQGEDSCPFEARAPRRRSSLPGRTLLPAIPILCFRLIESLPLAPQAERRARHLQLYFSPPKCGSSKTPPDFSSLIRAANLAL